LLIYKQRKQGKCRIFSLFQWIECLNLWDLPLKKNLLNENLLEKENAGTQWREAIECQLPTVTTGNGIGIFV
jgi:hypothetical protein